MLDIRTATIEDIAIIQELAKNIWPRTYLKIFDEQQVNYMFELTYSYDALQKQIEEEKHHFLLCYDDQTPVGWASYNIATARHCKLQKLYVLSNHQGKGIGAFLIDHVIKQAKQLDATKLSLNVNFYNPSAIAFYKRLGFVMEGDEITTLTDEYKIHDHIMVLSLS